MLTLKFDQEPDYDSVINAIKKALNNYMTSKKLQNHKFEWNVIYLTLDNNLLIVKHSEQVAKEHLKRAAQL